MTQVSPVVASLRVLVSWPMGHPMTLVFGNPLHPFAVAADGETPWLEGVLLVGVYVLLGLAFFVVAPAG